MTNLARRVYLKQFDKGQELSIPTDFCKQMCNTRRQRDSDHDKTLTKILIKGETSIYLTESVRKTVPISNQQFFFEFYPKTYPLVSFSKWLAAPSAKLY